MEIKLNLILSLIVEAVKAETYIKGSIDRAAGNDQHASNGVAFHETAGDEDVHERKILRGIYTSADKLRSYIQDYLEEGGCAYGDNSVVIINESTSTITLKMNVSKRFRNTNSDSLARLCSKFIEDNTLVLWWGAIGSQSQIQFYQNLLNEDIDAIHKMFIKSAPKFTTIPYTNSISIIGTTNSEISIAVGEEDSVTYTIDSNVIDDIVAVSDSPCVKMKRKEGILNIKGVHSGIANITLYSVHDETVYDSMKCIVSDIDGVETNYHENHRPPFPHMYPHY